MVVPLDTATLTPKITGLKRTRMRTMVKAQQQAETPDELLQLKVGSTSAVEAAKRPRMDSTTLEEISAGERIGEKTRGLVSAMKGIYVVDQMMARDAAVAKLTRKSYLECHKLLVELVDTLKIPPAARSRKDIVRVVEFFAETPFFVKVLAGLASSRRSCGRYLGGAHSLPIVHVYATTGITLWSYRVLLHLPRSAVEFLEKGDVLCRKGKAGNKVFTIIRGDILLERYKSSGKKRSGGNGPAESLADEQSFPPEQQLIVFEVGVEGWDRTAAGKGTFEDEAELHSLFSLHAQEAHGTVVAVAIKHRVKHGSNTSFAIVTMDTEICRDAVMGRRVMAGSTPLIMQKFDHGRAAVSAPMSENDPR